MHYTLSSADTLKVGVTVGVEIDTIAATQACVLTAATVARGTWQKLQARAITSF